MSKKESLTFSGIISYLESNKKVKFESINEKQAESILKMYGYHNVIAPFKFKMAQRNPKNKSKSLRVEGKHVYSRRTDFGEWYELFVAERKHYPQIYTNVINIKTAFKNIMFNSIYTSNNINNAQALEDFFSKCKLNSIKLGYDSQRRGYIADSMDNLINETKDTYSIYYMVGIAGLGDCNNLFNCLSESEQKDIIYKLQDLGLCPRPISAAAFNNRMVKIQYIRNCVMHNDSLEILCRFRVRSKKYHRTDTDRKEYQKLVRNLSKSGLCRVIIHVLQI